MVKYCHFLKKIIAIIFLVFVNPISAQEDSVVGTAKISALIKSEKFNDAREELYRQIEHFKTQGNFDTLTAYIEFIGNKAIANDSWVEAVNNSRRFVEELKTKNNPSISVKALESMAWIYSDAGQPNLAYKACKEALNIADQLVKDKAYRKASIQYSLGYYASVMGNFADSNRHYKKSLTHINKSKKDDPEFYQQLYNALGGVMWNSAKMDSCLYYFEQSLKALKKTDSIPINLYYRPALVNMNLAVVSNNLGNSSEAINYSKNAIKDFQLFIETGKDQQKISGAKRSRLAAIDNLGVFYNTLGEFKKAEELIDYSFKQKQNMFNDEDPNIIISKIILAQAKLNTQDLVGAEKLLKSAIKSSEENPKRVIYWYMAANTTLAKVLAQQDKFEEAESYAATGESYIRSYYKGNYNNDLLDELGSMAVFYANRGSSKKAIELANEIYEQVNQGDFKNTLQGSISKTKVAEVYYKLKDYKAAKHYSSEVIQSKLEIGNGKSNRLADSILSDYSKPSALLINAKATYEQLKNPSNNEIKSILKKVEKGIDLIEKRKTILANHEDLGLLISQNNDLFNFAKKLQLQLYNSSKNEVYLNEVVNLHESALYNRIRSRLNLKNDISFADIPNTVLTREKKLKKALSTSLDEGNIDIFFDIQNNWNNFRDSLKQHFPKYFKMRYGTITQSIDDIQSKIPEATTVVRYLFIEDDLYAFIINSSEKSIVKLNNDNLKDNIEAIHSDLESAEKSNSQYHQLYLQLWKPFESKITTKNIIIVPDAELFNLSFETLSTRPISSFQDFRTSSLLAKYNLSYNYSLALVGVTDMTVDYKNDFVAFAPEFSKSMKDDYLLAISDSLSLDKTYLTLLPQPFSVDLAKEYSNIFNGSSFINENATKQIFIDEANEHKIIHIGTHAESNNVSPELSRLVFAKSKENIDDNYLYTYEIYNHNLNSDLAILTACETGKPTYQSGEGMISLAHAFNYAGSESILTSLWKIDEESSTNILNDFYKHLSRGLPKDQALRQAKLNYLETAQGRTLAPEYWAGMVLIGDALPIELDTSFDSLYLIIGCLVIMIVGLLVFGTKRLKS